jgi:phosphinothricin acetyltransferase
MEPPTSPTKGSAVSPVIRPARAEDAPAIAAIYNEAVVGSTATFDTEPKSVEERAEWLAAHDERHPVLVVEQDGIVAGWGSLSRFGDRAAWDHTVEISVYLAATHQGRGLGPAMTTALVDAARELGHHVVVARICSENVASVAMTERAGFTRAGTLHEVGRKFDRWLDVDILELRLS